ncbi:SIR2 family protein [Glutamicibacter sp. MCAF14]|uniref:SIR2 family protein n=1 Tax=Glutamicibacter sp. MCAF14 TaxID=3233043 RepID=UPI003F92C803
MKFSGDAKDLVRRIGRALEPVDRKKPIAFLFGSGLTLASVPGVNDIVIRARGAIDSRDHADFDREVATFEAPSEKYQAALGFVKKRFGAEFVDEIIAKCTLAAYDAENVSSVKIITDNHSKIERDYSNWNIPAGVESLGRILCGLPRNLRGKVLTTNFDPLIEVAISKAGSNPHPMGIDAGGQSIYVEQACDIYHLNGYWRDSITLHNVTDLKAERPNLSSMIRDIVTRSILVVVGYSGWIDAVMLAIEAMIDDGSARRADILWCTFENETKLVESFEKNEILKRLNNELTGIQFYTEIDANEFFPELEKAFLNIWFMTMFTGHLTYPRFRWVGVPENFMSGWIVKLALGQLNSSTVEFPLLETGLILIFLGETLWRLFVIIFVKVLSLNRVRSM